MPEDRRADVTSDGKRLGLVDWVRGPGCGTVLAAFAAGLLAAVAAAAVGSLITDSVSASLLFFEIGLLGGVVIYLVAAGQRIREAFRLGPVAGAVYPLALLLGIALLFANSAAAVLLGPSSRDMELVSSAVSAAERVIMMLTVALAAPVVEEALFRGLLQGALERRLRPWVAIAVAAVPFALMHGPRAAVFFFFWSLPLGWITWRTDSIRPGIVVHAVNNLVGLVGLLAAAPFDPASAEGEEELIPLALLVIAAAGLWAVHLCRRIAAVAGERAPGTAEPPGV